MKAAILHQYNSLFQIEDISVPSPGPGEILVQIMACGICGSDHFLQTGGFRSILPIVPGHEASGTVAGVGQNVEGFRIGERVAIYYIIHCGFCRACKKGQTNLCQNVKRIGVDVNGACAEYICVPQENVIPVPDNIGFVEAAVITDAVSTPYHALKMANVRDNDVVLVLGIGGIGSNALQLAKVLGATVIAFSRSDEKVQLAKQMGSDYVLQSKENLVTDIFRLTNGYGADIVLQCSPSAEMDALGFSCLGNAGQMILVAANQDTFSLRSVDFIWGEKVVKGSRGFTKPDIVDCMELFCSGRISINHLTGHTLPLDEMNQAMANLDDPKIVRSVVLPNRI